MKKLCLIFILCSLFVFAGCGSDSKNDESNDSADSQNDENSVDADTSDSENSADKTDSDNPDNSDTDKTDSDNPDTDNPDTDNPDTDNPDTDNPDTDNPDTDNPDTDNPDTDNPDTDNPDTDNPDTDNPDTGSEEIECTGISLDASTFMPYYENVYIGFVTDDILGDSSLPDMIEIDFFGGIAVNTYTSNNFNCTGTACLFVTPDYETEDTTLYFQKNGTINVSEYDPETLEMSAEISATLVEVVVTDNGLTLKENGGCITIETGVVRAEETSDHAIKTCAGITECKKGCDENEDCIENCFSDISAVARTQYLDLFSTCNEEHNCDNNYYCLWENCAEEEEICGMRGDTENYNIPYGEVTINGTFTYLHAEGETDILYSHALEAAFVEGTFGNNNTPIIDQDDSAALLSYAKIAPFKDVPEEKNITLVQTYKKVDGKSFGPTVHIVTTLREPGAYKLGLSDWEEEARLFVSDTDSAGEKICDHAFGVGTLNITAISWTPGETTISVNGTAKLYSYKASPHYGGDISGTKWVACEPK